MIAVSQLALLPKGKTKYIMSLSDAGYSFYLWVRREAAGFALYAQLYVKKQRRTIYLGFFKKAESIYAYINRAFAVLKNGKLVPKMAKNLELLLTAGKGLDELVNLISGRIDAKAVREAVKYVALAKGHERERRRVRYVLAGRLKKVADTGNLAKAVRLAFALSAFSKPGEPAHGASPTVLIKGLYRGERKAVKTVMRAFRSLWKSAPRSARPYIYEMALFALDALYEIDKSVSEALGAVLHNAFKEIDRKGYVKVKFLFDEKPGPGEKAAPKVALTKPKYLIVGHA
ncbi:MAG: hypothetical protein ACP5I3_11330 [Thermoproteus sp.]